MNNENEQLKNFVIIKRNIYYNFLIDGKINRTEFNILIDLFFKTNPVNGYAVVSYTDLANSFDLKKSYLRKIFHNLFSNKLVYFNKHKGANGSFKVWVIDFYKVDKTLNDFDLLKDYYLSHKEDLFKGSLRKQNSNSFCMPNNKNADIRCLSDNIDEVLSGLEVTTPYNDKDNKKDTENITK